MRKRTIIPGVDAKMLIKDAGRLMPDPARRGFLRGAASLGALTVLTGCDIVDSDTAETVLRRISTMNDRVQSWLFNPHALAPTFPESAITKPFPFNGYYPEDDAPEVDGADYKLEDVVGGEFVRRHGGRVHLAKLAPGHSTTDTIAKMAG